MPKSKSKTKRQSQPVAVPRRSFESERKINKLLSKIDRLKKPWEQTGLSNDELEFIVQKLTPIGPNNKKEVWAVACALRKQKPESWRIFFYAILDSIKFKRLLQELNSVWPGWEEELIEKQYQQIRKAMMDGGLVYEYNINRDRRITAVDSHFNWLEPHTMGEYAEAIAVNRKTIERFLKSIKAKPSTPARGPCGQQYSPTVGLKIFKAWLNKPRWLTVNTLKKSFPVSKKSKIKQPGESELRCQLGVKLLKGLYYDNGDEKLKEKFRSIIQAKLPGSKDAWLKELKSIIESRKSPLDRIQNKINEILANPSIN